MLERSLLLGAAVPVGVLGTLEIRVEMDEINRKLKFVYPLT